MFLTVVYDYSRHTWIFLLKHKRDAVTVLKSFAAYVHTQFGCDILGVRSDNAKKLCEGEMLKFYLENGILHKKSYTESPQQNGIVEREHRHLLETGRDLYFQSNVPAYLWGECLLSACHLINRMPLSSLG